MTWDRPIFMPNAQYRVKRTFVSGLSKFNESEIVTFERHGYSFYDSSFIYTFRSETDKDLKSWWLHDDEPNDLWKDQFELVEK
jgi:hypothetical protein